MFSIFKNTSTEQDIVLQDLTEEQLAQAAGGRDNDHDWDDHKKAHHHHHHMHHHMHHHPMHHNDHDWDDRKNWQNTASKTQWGGHW